MWSKVGHCHLSEGAALPPWEFQADLLILQVLCVFSSSSLLVLSGRCKMTNCNGETSKLKRENHPETQVKRDWRGKRVSVGAPV